ncbi:MAG: GTP cyclohydrolase FolE2 [Myxococcota bacterium]
MPDIAEKGASVPGTLERVGMSDIEVPIRLLGMDGQIHIGPALASAFVSLDDPTAKGIHMSRLFLSLQEILERDVLSFDTLADVVHAFKGSHGDLSSSAHVSIAYTHMRKRAALVSEHAGWRHYPITLSTTLEGGQVRHVLETVVTYSSTCPCSAALARQLIQEAFDRDFRGASTIDATMVRQWLGTEEAIRATPHSQRSEATIKVELIDGAETPSVDTIIDYVEGALKTVVQAAVKREDEQAFALLNGQNLMFCEDAARRIKHALDADTRIIDYRAEVSHHESLHPHDAVAVTVKGRQGGFTA